MCKTNPSQQPVIPTALQSQTCQMFKQRIQSLASLLDKATATAHSIKGKLRKDVSSFQLEPLLTVLSATPGTMPGAMTPGTGHTQR